MGRVIVDSAQATHPSISLRRLVAAVDEFEATIILCCKEPPLSSCYLVTYKKG